MTSESTFIALMRGIATDPAARGLNDDAAILKLGTQTLVITHDMMVESVHWLTDANPADVAWKLVATNLSDLASKGARPIGVMLGYMLGDDAWDRAFATGLRDALAQYQVPLLGGDTIKAAGKLDARSIGMTAIGLATSGVVPSRSGAVSDDILYVAGNLGDAFAGYELARQGKTGPETLLNAFKRPVAMIAEGRALAAIVHAMMDISDGLLLDAQRMADASKLAVSIDLAAIPISEAYIAQHGDTPESRLSAATWGDDYALLFACSPGISLPVSAAAIGHFSNGAGLSLHYAGTLVDLPNRLGFEHSH
jgi:thiamine-monophosphate kinase